MLTSGFKRCNCCKELLHLTEFSRDSSIKSGYVGQCKECLKKKDTARNRAKGVKPKRLLTDEQRREKALAKRKRSAAKKKEAYLREHGQPPECECGCGERVNFNSNGNPNRFILGHASRMRRNDYSARMREHRAKIREEQGYIPVEDFARAVREYRDARQLTWAEVAEHGGISQGHLNTLIYQTSNTKSVSREWATNFFRRLANLPAPPGPAQLKKIDGLKKATKETESRL